jgi:flavin reductase (DIM6/NTAB) family NADH-FMN oxidoreductase RutF
MSLKHVTPALFRGVCSKFATGVTIVTVLGPEGEPHGLTANSFTSVSLTPPLVLICIDHSASILPLFRSALHFGINILNEDQKDMSTRFARKGQNRFHGIEWRAGRCGVPELGGVLAFMECTLLNSVDAGDHAILIGEVTHAEVGHGNPLLYFDSGYRTLYGGGW